MQVSPLSRRSSDISANGTAQATESLTGGKQDKPTYRPQIQRTPSAISTITTPIPTPTPTPTGNEAAVAAPQPDKTTLKRKLNILLTEDNIINQRVIAAQLRRLGNIVHVANHGLEALQFLPKTTFAAGCPPSPSLPTSNAQDGAPAPAPIPLDVMLLDQGKIDISTNHEQTFNMSRINKPLVTEMPVLDGLATIKKVREWQQQGYLNAHLPVIAVTANARGEQKDELVDSGCDVSSTFRIPFHYLSVESANTHRLRASLLSRFGYRIWWCRWRRYCRNWRREKARWEGNDVVLIIRDIEWSETLVCRITTGCFWEGCTLHIDGCMDK